MIANFRAAVQATVDAAMANTDITRAKGMKAL